LRLLRALRFAAKLHFGLHPTFWLAVPFALAPLQSKVAGSRKNTELLKIAKAGTTPLLDFFTLAFGRKVMMPHATRGSANKDAPAGAAAGAGDGAGAPALGTLATCLFGGADPKGIARFLAAPNGFDDSLMRSAAAALPPALGEDEALGTGLAAAALACGLPWGTSADAASEMTVDVDDGAPADGAAIMDAAAAAAAEAARGQLAAACDGLCASRDLRAAAETPLMCTAALLQPAPHMSVHELFADAASGGGANGGGGISPAEFAAMVHMWDTLKLEKWLQGKAGAGYHPHFVVALAAVRCSPSTAATLSRHLERLLVPSSVSINGKALVGLSKIPPAQRGVVISNLQVLSRLRGETALELTQAPQLQAYLEESCSGLLTALYDAWYDEAGSLRPAYTPVKGGVKKQKGS
jgi:hypothetical protein